MLTPRGGSAKGPLVPGQDSSGGILYTRLAAVAVPLAVGVRGCVGRLAIAGAGCVGTAATIRDVTTTITAVMYMGYFITPASGWCPLSARDTGTDADYK